MGFDPLHGLLSITKVMAANAEVVDTFAFVAPTDSQFELVGASEVHDAKGTDGSAVTLDVKRCASGTTVASGTSMLASTFNLKSDADTPVHKTVANGGVHQTESSRIISGGQSIALDIGGTATAVAGLAVTLWLRPLRRPTF